VNVRDEVLQGLDPRFLAYYRDRFTGDRMIYGHWSEGLYTRAIGTYHKQVAVARPVELDEAIQKYTEARNRRIGGAIPAMWHAIEEYKAKAVLQTFTNARYDEDLPDHTPHREVNSIALAIMCGWGARPNDLGQAEPLPLQLRALAELIAEACTAVDSPVERFLTHSEAADNLDWPTPGDAAAPHPPCGFRTTREAWDLEAWVEPPSLAVHAPLQSARPGWFRLGDWLRETALQEIARRTRSSWARD